jgi:hypothetical protein
MLGGPLKGVLVTLLAGLPQALTMVPDLGGLRFLSNGLMAGEPAAVVQALRLAVGFCTLALGVAFALRARSPGYFVALAGLSILPIVWNNVYAYPKFYLLLPALVAHVVAAAGGRGSAAVVLVLALLNVSSTGFSVARGRELVSARRAHFAQADAATHWVTSGWVPEPPYLWRGPSCGMLASLGRPSRAATVEELRVERTGEFERCLRDAFCGGSPVWTDDWLHSRVEALVAVANHHGLAARVVEASLWRGTEDGFAVDTNPRHGLYVFSEDRARTICAALPAESR